MGPLVTRARILDILRSTTSVATIIAPAGFGKSVALDQGPGFVRVAVGATEGHAGLLADAIAQRLKKVFPGASGAARALAALKSDPPGVVMERVLEQLPAGTTLTLAFDEVDQLPADSDGLELVRALVQAHPAAVRVILSGRPPLSPVLVAAVQALPEPATSITSEAMAFDELELATLVARHAGEPRPALAARVMRETLGWPALVVARLEAGLSELSADELAKAFTPIVEAAVSGLRADVRFLAQIAAVAGRADRPFLQAVASGDVPGSADARRRLVRLDPIAVTRARDELERLSLTVPGGADPGRAALHPAVRLVLRERFRAADQAGYLEAHRRAGELLLAGQRLPSADVVELFSIAEERERVMDLLAKHGPRLELELAAANDDARIVRWVEALERTIPTLPFWGDALAGLVIAREGDPNQTERAKERLERARAALSSERKETVLWRWQPRIAEGQALAAKAKGAWSDARSWLLRGLDQLAQTKKRGIVAKAEETEANELELRLLFELARLSHEAASWDKTKEPLVAAAALLDKVQAAPDDPRRLELRALMVAGAASAGDKAVLAAEHEGDAIGNGAAAWQALLDDGRPDAAVGLARAGWDAAHTALERAVAGILFARIAPMPDSAQVLAIVSGLGAERRLADPVLQPFALEAQLRSARSLSEPVSPDGWLGALQLEMQGREVEGSRRPRALELARDAWRRVGARWEEVRIFLELAALAERRMQDGDNDARDQLARSLDGAIEVASGGGFAVPWDVIGDARRVDATLRAGFRVGSERVRAATRSELERRGADVKALVPEGRRAPPIGTISATTGQAKRLAQQSGASYVGIGRTGAQALSDGDYQALVESKSPNTFVVLVPDKVVLNFGKRVPLGQKRIMLPLLLELLRSPEVSFSMLELARRVWDATELTPTVVTKVKVAVSRLRALLGRNRAYINTTRKDENGESVVAYQVAPQLNFMVVETVREL